MDLIITHMSALDFFRKIYPAAKTLGSALEFVPQLNPAWREEDVWSLAPSWVTLQFLHPESGFLHVLSFDASKRSYAKTCHSHIWSAPLPAFSLYQLNKNTYVASPAFALLEMACSLSFTQTVALTCELCGLYTFDEAQERGIRQRRTPLTSKHDLEQFLVNAKGLQGSDRMKHALRYTIERSASPMETTCALLLCLPYRYGGYGLPTPEMNYEKPLTEAARKLVPGEHFLLDVAWPEHHLVLEYLGEHDHSRDPNVKSDRARTIALEEMGYTVIEVAGNTVWDLQAFELVARKIARALGKRVENKYLGPLPARVELRQQLKSWNAASGRPQ